MPPHRLTMLVFLLQPIAFGAWLPRIPDIQQQLGLGPSGLALALLGLPVGTLVTLPFAGRLVGRIGAKATIFFGFIAFLAMVSLPGWAFSAESLFLMLALVGATLTTLELGLNVQADRVEKATGKHIMSTCHGFWSLGIMTGSIVGSFVAGYGVPANLAISAVALACLPFSLLAARALPDYGGDGEANTPSGRLPFKLPSPALLAICIFTFGIAMTEGAMADWSAVFLRQEFRAAPAEAGLGYSVFAFFVAASRFTGDALRQRFGSVALARFCGVSALLGIGAILSAPTTWLAISGFGLIGFGASVGFPLGVTAAASLSDRPAASSVATLSFLALCGFLVGPPMIGFVAEHIGLRAGLATLLPALLVSLALTGALRARAAA